MWPLPVSCTSYMPNDASGKTTSRNFLGLIGAGPYYLKQRYRIPRDARIYEVLRDVLGVLFFANILL